MLQNIHGVSIYGKSPLWYNNDGQYDFIQNDYCNDNIICVDYDDTFPKHHQEYKIGKNYTIIPEKALILFKDQNEAIKYNSLLENDQGRHIFLYNSFVDNREEAIPLPEDCYDIESGLYCLDEYENRMDESCKQHSLDEIRYLDVWNFGPYEMKTQKPKIINSNSTFGKFCKSQLDIPVETITFEHLGKYIEQECKLSYRVFFEVYNKENCKCFSIFKIFATSDVETFYRFSDLNGYAILADLEDALNFRNLLISWNNIWAHTIESYYRAYVSSKEYKEHCDKIRNNIITAAQFVLSNTSQIVAGVKYIASGQFTSMVKGLFGKQNDKK